MSLKLLAIDLGKRSFHCYGIDEDGIVISRKTSRAKLLETIQELGPETIAMEGSIRISGVSRSGGLNGGSGVVVGEARVPSFEQWPERAVEGACPDL